VPAIEKEDGGTIRAAVFFIVSRFCTFRVLAIWATR